MAVGKKPDLSVVHPWGCKIWVKRLNVGKLEPRAEECRFVGVDSESKGYRVYWPGRNRVGIERDVYFNENEVLAPEEIQIEGGNDIFTNPNHPQPYPNSQTNSIPPQPVVIASNRSNENDPEEAPIETPLNQPKTGNPENPTSAPHERHAR